MWNQSGFIYLSSGWSWGKRKAFLGFCTAHLSAPLPSRLVLSLPLISSSCCHLLLLELECEWSLVSCSSTPPPHPVSAACMSMSWILSPWLLSCWERDSRCTFTGGRAGCVKFLACESVSPPLCSWTRRNPPGFRVSSNQSSCIPPGLFCCSFGSGVLILRGKKSVSFLCLVAWESLRSFSSWFVFSSPDLSPSSRPALSPSIWFYILLLKAFLPLFSNYLQKKILFRIPMWCYLIRCSIHLLVFGCFWLQRVVRFLITSILDWEHRREEAQQLWWLRNDELQELRGIWEPARRRRREPGRRWSPAAAMVGAAPAAVRRAGGPGEVAGHVHVPGGRLPGRPVPGCAKSPVSARCPAAAAADDDWEGRLWRSQVLHGSWWVCSAIDMHACWLFARTWTWLDLT